MKLSKIYNLRFLKKNECEVIATYKYFLDDEVMTIYLTEETIS